MSTTDLIQQEVKGLPEEKIQEVLDFTRFLKSQMKKEQIRTYLHQELAEIDSNQAGMLSEEDFWKSTDETLAKYE